MNLADEGDRTFWKGAGVAVVVSAIAIGALLWVGSSGPASGFRKAWVWQQWLVTDEYRMDEGDEVGRVAVYELSTGRRVAYEHYDLQYQALGLADGRFWVASTASKPGVMAYTIPVLATSVDKGDLAGAFAPRKMCFDAGKAKLRATMLDGQIRVVDLKTKALGDDEALDCADDGRLGPTRPTGWTGAPAPAPAAAPAVKPPPLLLSKPVPSCDDSVRLALHAASLADGAPWRLSRLTDAVLWTQDVGDFGEVVSSYCLPPSTLVLVGSKRVIAIDVKDGTVRWRI